MIPQADITKMLQANNLTPSGVIKLNRSTEVSSPKETSFRPPTQQQPSFRGTDRHLSRLLTKDKRMLELKDRIKQLAPTSFPVLLLGETGTGKELLARALHGERGGKFICVNCGGFPENIVDSILFGHLKGSFTGAEKDKVGLFQAANGGTIFLDEIGDLPLHMQAKLLRVLQEGEVCQVGDIETTKVDVRVVAATNKLDLEKNRKIFRSDLYWRLSTFTEQTVPLRERRDDVQMYVQSQGVDWDTFVQAYERRIGGLELANWDGNYRELQQYIYRVRLFGNI